ncbi:tol-pal system protein YbgF [Paludibacterium yongneupense]|uniref:tol-pal system protein YbgF n=1 Tax=Paludibacterium yongneupense TaxID=400061 RepID=UPI0003FD9CEB|nr:tol-pal system protein YbgF [Paludibacterium yongneupense]
MKRFAIGSLLVVSLAGCATSSDLDATRQQLDQVTQQANRRLSDVESKLSNDKLLDLVTEIDKLKAEVAHMRGQLEEQNYTVQTTQKRQNDLYNDLDSRLAKLESASAPLARVAPPVPAGASAPAAQTAAAAGAAQASPDYDRALNLLRNRDFANASVALQRYIEQNPESPQTLDATYWLGVSHAAQRQYDAAIDIHRRFVEAHPENPHAPDAMRNIANCQRDLGQVDQARATLKRLIKLYPKTSAAIKAKEMLAHL